MKQTSHGGARQGSGRKPGYRDPNARRRQVNVRLDDSELAIAEHLGGGNASAGIREALRNASNRH